MKDFEIRDVNAEASPAEVLREAVSNWTAPLASWGYVLAALSDTTVTYNRKYRPWIAILVAIFFFPIGLLALLYTEHATITALAEPDEARGGTELVIKGSAPRKLRRSLEDLRSIN